MAQDIPKPSRDAMLNRHLLFVYGSNDLSGKSNGDRASVGVDEERSLSGPQLDFDDYESLIYLTDETLDGIWLWKFQLIHDKIQIMWQTYMAIETIGWPVAHLESFSNPVLHSTTANRRR
jgi:hypothetical protein